MRAAALALLAASGTAAAEPRGSANVELRMHVGDTEKDEVVHPGLFPSIVLGGRFGVTDIIEVEAMLAAATISAQWENIGGVATAYLGGRVRLGAVTLAAGVVAPTDYSIPAPACFMPELDPGATLVLDYGTNTSCWDRSAYRRAMIHRGGWNAWLWAPDFISGVATARYDRTEANMMVAVEAGLGVAESRYESATAVIGQLGAEAAYRVSRRWHVGGRAAIMGVLLDHESPALVSAEPYAEVAPRNDVRLRFSLLIPLADLSNDDVPPGRGGYKPSENVSIGVTGVVTIGR